MKIQCLRCGAETELHGSNVARCHVCGSMAVKLIGYTNEQARHEGAYATGNK